MMAVDELHSAASRLPLIDAAITPALGGFTVRFRLTK
jgi:hypothetical protein